MTEHEPGTERQGRAANDNRALRQEAPATRTAPKKTEKPSMGQRWGAVQASKTAVFWLMAAAIVLTMIVGFTMGGWVTGGSAQDTAAKTATNAVVMRLAPICVAQANQDPEIDAKLAELQEMSSFQRRSFVSEQGWATMPGEEDSDRNVATACANLLME